MNRKIILPGFVILFASIFASKYPDTLETLAINYGFANKAKETLSLFSGYSFPFIKNSSLSTLCAGLTGLLIIYILFQTTKKITTYFIK
ncbi:MAG: PDGLE domain-containing protein [Endomicrobium sp.]|jgi:cobalt/nickel transport protein|nr:PDGLE domain-containing protein [Endomicrobium sp.]